MSKKILIDCDAGMDDSIAIVMAAKSPELEILAITTVNGNYPVSMTSANAMKTLEMIGRTDIPVAVGMSEPMIRDVPKDPFTHGIDGQAENFLPDPTHPFSDKHAIELIIDTVKANPGEVTILAMAPLTNIAMAIKKAPEIKSMIPRIVAISGMFGLNEYAFKNATGDTPMSEWNVYVDPEATDVVYRSGIPIVALGLDVATHFDVNLGEKELAALEASDRPEAKFLRQSIRFVNGRGHQAYCSVIDCMTVGYVIDESLVETFDAHVGVETKNGLTLGMTVPDFRHHHVWTDLPVITIGKKADYGRFLNLLMDRVLK